MQQARSVVILIFLSWSVTSGVAAQLPPEVLVDRYMVQAERLIAEHDYDAALDAMDHVAELHARHSLTVPDEFHFVYAQVALAAGVVDAALESVTRYLAAAGRSSGAFYEDALTLWDEAEAEAARRVRANREAEASRQAELEAEQRREAERQQQKQREAEARRQAAAEMERQRRAALGPAVFLLNFDQDQARDLVRRCPHVRPMENLEEAHFVLYGDRPMEVRDSRGALAFATVAWSMLTDVCEYLPPTSRGLVTVKAAIDSAAGFAAPGRGLPVVFLGLGSGTDLLYGRTVWGFRPDEVQEFSRECRRVDVTRVLGLADYVLLNLSENWVQMWDTRGVRVGQFSPFRRRNVFKDMCEHFGG